MADYYQRQFFIGSEDLQVLELLDEAEDIARSWAKGKCGELLGDELRGEWRDENDATRIHIERGRLEDEDLGYWELVLEYLDEDTDALTWHVQIRFFTTEDELGGTIEVNPVWNEISEFDGAPSSINGKSHYPSILTTLAQRFVCRLGWDRITTEAERITEDSVNKFIYETVFDRNRGMPLVVVSENQFGGIFLSPDRLQSRLLGVARVATYDYKISGAINEALGGELECPDGSIRLYRPRCIPEDVSSRNPQWHWDEINDRLAVSGWDETLIEIENQCVDNSLSWHISTHHDRIRFQVLQKQHERVIEHLKQNQQNNNEHADNKLMLEDLTNTLAEYETQRTELERRFEHQRSEYERRIDGLLTENAELQDKVAQLNLALHHYESDSDLEDDGEQPYDFDSVHGVVEHAATQYERIRFFSRAVETCTGFGISASE